MKQYRRVYESSDFSAEDRHAHKYSKRAGTNRDKHLADEMASRHRESPEDRRTHNAKQAHHSHGKRPTGDVARENSRESRNRHSHRRNDGGGSGSSDEILIKHRASRRLQRDNDKAAIARQLKSIEKAQREALRPLSTTSQEIHIHYVPVVTTSTSPPLATSRQPRLRSSLDSACDDHVARITRSSSVSASEITNQLRDITKSLLRERDQSRSRSQRNKHERRDKHGKKKDWSKFLAPLAQRWVCYECGKLRSDTIQDRHHLREGQKMQPNWCGKCRVHGELQGRPLSWNGQRHYCWGCGIVRSKEYHRENPLGKYERSTANYCRPCRELSPSFDYNLREASEIGSELNIRDKAFSRQMEDAELSDVEEDEEETIAAPGKENENPKPRKGLKATRSFMLKNCDFRTKTTSNDSSEGSMPLNMIESLNLDGDNAPISAGEGARLSAGSYKPPYVESTTGGSSRLGTQGFGEDTAIAGATYADSDCGTEDLGASRPGHDEQASSPTIIASTQPAATTTSSSKKKVHWTTDDGQPMTAESAHPYNSDSGFSSGYRSDVSMKSTGSRGRRRNPADISKGSPLEREGAIPVENIGDGVNLARENNEGCTSRPQSNIHAYGRDNIFHEASGCPTREAIHQQHEAGCLPMAIPSQTLSGFPGPTLPTPSESYDSAAAKFSILDDQVDGHTDPTYWNYGSQSPFQQFPNFSRPHQSPSKPGLGDARNLYGNPVSSPGYGTRPDYHAQPYAFHSSTYFSDSTTRRDFSGYEAPGFDVYSSPEDDHGAGQRFAPTSSSEGGNHDYLFQSRPTGPSAFDFSQFGEACHGSEATGEKFVRAKKFADAGASKQNIQTPNKRHSWQLYDNGGVDGGETGGAGSGGCQWRDGRTTMHCSGRTPSSGNLVTILSIEEIKSDDELSDAGDGGEDDDDGSEIDTVINVATMKTVRPA